MPIPAPWAVPDPVRKRERGLRRVGTATRWTATAAAAGAIVLGAGYAHAASGSAGPAKAPSTPTQHAQHTPSSDDDGYGDDNNYGSSNSGNLQPPPQIPQPVQQLPQTTSGAS